MGRGRQDYEGAPIEGVTGNVAGSTISDYGSQNFTGSERFEFDNDDDGGSVTSPTTGLTKSQFENRFGITNRNPYGNTGFANFFDKISGVLGGSGVDYRAQLNRVDDMMRKPRGYTAGNIRDRQYQLYSEPVIDQTTGQILSGGIDREGRGTTFGPVERVYRDQPFQEQIARGITSLQNPMIGAGLSGLGTTELVDSRFVTDEMRNRGPQSIGGMILNTLTGGVDTSSLGQKAKDAFQRGISSLNLSDRLNRVASGQVTQAPTNFPVPRTADELAAASTVAQPNPIDLSPVPITEANLQGPMMPAEQDPRLSDTTTADMLRDPSIATPTPRPDLPLPDTYARNFGMNPAKPEDLFTAQDLFPELRNAPNVGMNPARPQDTFTLQDVLPRNAPNVGMLPQIESDLVDDERSEFFELYAPEPELGPYEQSQAPTRDLRDSTAVAGLDSSKITDALSSGILTDLLQGQLPSTSVPLGRGRLSIDPSLKEPKIEFRMPLEGKDLGIGEVLNFITGDAGTRDQGSFDVAEMIPASSISDVLSSYGVNLPPGRTVDTETLDVFNRSGKREGNIRSLMRGNRDEGFSLPQLLSSYRTT